jgi:hypothetical protein
MQPAQLWLHLYGSLSPVAGRSNKSCTLIDVETCLKETRTRLAALVLKLGMVPLAALFPSPLIAQGTANDADSWLSSTTRC